MSTDKKKTSYQQALESYMSRPIGDASRWWELHYQKHGLMWPGVVNPDAPLTHEEEKQRPEWGHRKGPEPGKWVTCARCGVEWKSLGCVLFETVIYPTVCNPCTDRLEAKKEYGPKKLVSSTSELTRAKKPRKDLE